MSESQPNRTKIEIHTRGGDGVDIETPWVDQLAPNQYRLMNLPFFAYGLSLGDVVKAETTEDSDLPVYRHVVKPSGRRLVRSRFDISSVGLDVHLEHFAGLGCHCEPILEDAVCIDVPADVTLGAIAEYLLEHAVNWEFANPTYASLYRSRKSRTYDPLHVDPADRNGAYEGFYCSYTMGMDTGNGHAQRLGRVAIRVAFDMLILEPEDFMWFSDKNDDTFQLMRHPENEFWCEFPEPDRNGSLGTTLSLNELRHLLRRLPDELRDIQNEYDFQFKSW